MGFKEVIIGDSFQDGDYYDDLTLRIRPNIRGNWYCMGDYSSDLVEKLKTLKGWDSTSDIYTCSDNDRIPIKTVINGNDIEIGCYLKNRNLVILYVNIFCTILSLELKNEYIFTILEWLKEWLKKNKLEKVNASKVMEEKLIEKFCQEAKERISSRESNIVNYNSQIKNYQESIVNNLRNVKVMEAELTGLVGLVKNAKGTVKKQMSEIKKLPIVKSARLSGKGISVKFKDVIKIKHENQDVEIGEFTLYLRPNSIEIVNKNPLDRNRNTLHHPHISSDGQICFGDRKQKVYELLASYEFKKLVYFVFLFLKSYNPSDRYFSLKYWIDDDYESNSDGSSDEDDEHEEENDEGEEDS